MTIEAFGGDFSILSDLYATAPDRLAAQETSSTVTERFVEMEGGTAVAEVRLIERPDDKAFLAFRGMNPDLAGLVGAAAAGRITPLYLNADAAEFQTYEGLGFERVMTSEAFKVEFERSLSLLARARKPPWCAILDAANADVERLSHLDNQLRPEIAGLEGWDADVEWMRQEVSAPEIHRHAYLVAKVRETDEYIGLIRMWRNPSGPRLGMVGVVKEFRGTLVGPALIQRALASASTWGFAEFSTETQITNRSIHARLKNVGTSQGVFAQMRRDGHR